MTRYSLVGLRASVLFSLTIFVVGCGDKIYIAKKAHFQVTYSDSTAAVSFDLAPEYDVKVNRQYPYEVLGALRIFPNQEFQSSTIQSELHADSTTILIPWPTTEMNRFPNGKKLPNSFRNGMLEQWLVENDELGLGLLYQVEPDLIIGGVIYSDQFEALPENFLATQRFFGPNGGTVASISVMGRTATTRGGLLFLGNLGINPFDSSPSFRVLEATEPAKIISRGKTDFPLWLNIQKLIENLGAELEDFYTQDDLRLK